MTEKETNSEEAYWKEKCKKGKGYHTSNASGGAIYGLGIIGAAIYFISNAAGFWAGVVGFLKALVWPAFLVYQAFDALAG